MALVTEPEFRPENPGCLPSNHLLSFEWHFPCQSVVKEDSFEMLDVIHSVYINPCLPSLNVSCSTPVPIMGHSAPSINVLKTVSPNAYYLG